MEIATQLGHAEDPQPQPPWPSRPSTSKRPNAGQRPPSHGCCLRNCAAAFLDLCPAPRDAPESLRTNQQIGATGH
eukprot:11160088-Lingulodinium_polyedra.AAC.1